MALTWAIGTSITFDAGTDAIALPSPAVMAAKFACVVTPLASTEPMALTWARAASLRAPPSIAAPITSALSIAWRTAFGVAAPPGGVRARSELQSMPFRNGYAAADSLPAAASICALLGALTAAGVMGLAFTTSLNSMSAE